MNKKNIKLLDLFEHYSKKSNKSIKENRKVLKEYGTVYPNEPTKKCSVRFYYDTEDQNLTPSTFSMDIRFFVTFNSEQIRQEFGDAGDVEDDVITKAPSEDEIESDINKAMSGKKQTNKVSTKTSSVNYERFYMQIVRKKLSDYSLEIKLRRLIQSGVINLGDFNLNTVTYGSDSNDKSLWSNFVRKDQKNSKASPIRLEHGIEITLAANNKRKKYSPAEVKAVGQAFSVQFEKAILTDSEYLSFDKAVQKPTVTAAHNEQPTDTHGSDSTNKISYGKLAKDISGQDSAAPVNEKKMNMSKMLSSIKKKRKTKK